MSFGTKHGGAKQPKMTKHTLTRRPSRTLWRRWIVCSWRTERDGGLQYCCQALCQGGSPLTIRCVVVGRGAVLFDRTPPTQIGSAGKWVTAGRPTLDRYLTRARSEVEGGSRSVTAAVV